MTITTREQGEITAANESGRPPVVFIHGLWLLAGSWDAWPLPISALKASFPVLGKPGNRKKAVTLTFDQFRYGFANAVDEDEAHDLYERFHVAAAGRPLFQAATANVNPKAVTRVDTAQADRGPLLVISGGDDNIVPWALANAAFKIQDEKNPNPTEIVVIAGVGHSLVIDSHWTEVADATLAFLAKHDAGPAAA